MRGWFGTSWSVRWLLLAFVWTICLAGSAHAVAVHHCQDAPMSLCECVDSDVSDTAIIQRIATLFIPPAPASLVTTPLLITPRNLSPHIFQPPEAA